MMKRLQRAALLARLVDELREHGSWSGETHIQKAAFFLQELLDVPTGFEFILYRHGPFSFDLRDELTSLRADGILDLEPQMPPYGPKFTTTMVGRDLQERFPKTLGDHGQQIAFVAQTIGPRDVAELEQLATALYVTLEQGEVEGRAERVHALKPHIAVLDATHALAELERIRSAARQLRSIR